MTDILLVIYPFILFFSFRDGRINFAILFLIIISLLRLLSLPAIFSQGYWIAKLLPSVGLLFAITSWLLAKYQLLLYYPVMINLILLTLFGYSLKKPPTIIERFARMQHQDLPEKAIIYTRKVTICWCCFFIFNGSVALVTCLLGRIEWWTLYNGGISYMLIMALMGGEWLIRKKLQH